MQPMTKGGIGSVLHPAAQRAMLAGVGGGYHPMPKPQASSAPVGQNQAPAAAPAPVHAPVTIVMPQHPPQQTYIPGMQPVAPAIVPMLPPAPMHPVNQNLANLLLQAWAQRMHGVVR